MMRKRLDAARNPSPNNPITNKSLKVAAPKITQERTAEQFEDDIYMGDEIQTDEENQDFKNENLQESNQDIGGGVKKQGMKSYLSGVPQHREYVVNNQIEQKYEQDTTGGPTPSGETPQ